jgi:hypothetical protein
MFKALGPSKHAIGHTGRAAKALGEEVKNRIIPQYTGSFDRASLCGARVSEDSLEREAICTSLRPMIRAGRHRPSNVKTRVKKSGMPNGLLTLRDAPVLETLRTRHGTALAPNSINPG